MAKPVGGIIYIWASTSRDEDSFFWPTFKYLRVKSFDGKAGNFQIAWVGRIRRLEQ